MVDGNREEGGGNKEGEEEEEIDTLVMLFEAVRLKKQGVKERQKKGMRRELRHTENLLT